MNHRLTSGFLGALLVLLSLAAPVGARTFTDRQGRKIEAEITGVSGSKVTLRLANGKSYTLPVSRLSDADQFFVSMWKDAPEGGGSGKEGTTGVAIPPGIQYAIEIEADKKRVKKRPTIESDTGEVTPEEWIFEVKLENGSRARLEGLEMSYRIYVDPKASEKIEIGDPPRFFGHRTKLEPMADRARVTVKTEMVVLNKLELSPDYVFTDGSRNDLDDDLEGIWIKLWHGDKKVADYQSSSGTVKKAKWPDDEVADPEGEGAAGNEP